MSEKKSYEEKVQLLHEIMEKLAEEPIAVAFSGGVDSSLLLKAAVEHTKGKESKVYALTANTELHPASDLAIARRQAEEIGAEHMVLELNELREVDIRSNPVDRCYLCKKYLFSSMMDRLGNLQVKQLIEGTNAEDLLSYRPGIRALQDLGIRSPLMEAEFTKEDVRRLAQSYGISVAKRPSTPCLATRFPYGARLTREKLERVEQGEAFLKTLGLHNLRLRVHEDIARIEVDTEELAQLLDNRQAIVSYLKNLGYTYVTVDLEGFRSGSMDVHLDKK